MEARAFTAIVHGLVQGVAFRHHTRVVAARLNLSGFVRNLPNGSVEIAAEGPKEPLEELAEWIHHGPDYARVERVDLEWCEPRGQKGPFTIRF